MSTTSSSSSSSQAQDLAKVTVFASLPRIVPINGADINLHPVNWKWVPCLTLPVMRLNALRLSKRPYKWIQYAIGVVIGAHGDLSTQSELTAANEVQVVDYNAELPTNSTDLYYHTSDEERQGMFPLDPTMLRTQITTSATSQHGGAFREAVAARDGQRCIWTGLYEEFCEAVHLVSHNKTDEYILTWTRHRGRGDEGNTVTEIDDTRNGLFLNKFAHVLLGQQLAFLKTPNFAMHSDDVDENAEPNTTMYTAHIIQHNQNHRLPADLVPNTRLNIPNPLDPQFPPDILFDAVYACMVLCHFGTRRMKDGITRKWEKIFYSDGPKTRAIADHMKILGEHDTAAAKKERDASDRQACAERRAGGAHHNAFDFDLLAVPYILVPTEELQAMERATREEEEKEEAAERKRVQDRVEEWVRQIQCS